MTGRRAWANHDHPVVILPIPMSGDDDAEGSEGSRRALVAWRARRSSLSSKPCLHPGLQIQRGRRQRRRILHNGETRRDVCGLALPQPPPVDKPAGRRRFSGISNQRGRRGARGLLSSPTIRSPARPAPGPRRFRPSATASSTIATSLNAEDPVHSLGQDGGALPWASAGCRLAAHSRDDRASAHQARSPDLWQGRHGRIRRRHGVAAPTSSAWVSITHRNASSVACTSFRQPYGLQQRTVRNPAHRVLTVPAIVSSARALCGRLRRARFARPALTPRCGC